MRQVRRQTPDPLDLARSAGHDRVVALRCVSIMEDRPRQP
jgi:hypothetical protein